MEKFLVNLEIKHILIYRMTRIKILIIFLLTTFSISSFAQTRRERKEENGFKWIETTEAGNKHGAQTTSGKTLIPTRYDFITYHAGGDYFRAKSGNYYACYDRNGNCIINENRGYSNIFKHIDSSDGKVWFSVYKNGKQGACDANGREVVAPVLSDIVWSFGEFKTKNSNGKWVAVKDAAPNSLVSNSNSSRTTSTSSTKTNVASSSTSSAASLTPAQAYEKGKSYYNSKNYSAALPYIRSAAERGNSDAIHRLGYMYQYGLGVTQNYTTALSWYRKGEAKNNSNSMNNIGYMYENGYGVPKNMSEAIAYYKKAANAGSKQAKENLQILGENYTPGSNSGSNSNNSSKSAYDIKIYNTWMMAPGQSGFWVPGNGIQSREGVAHVTNSQITFSGNLPHYNLVYRYVSTDKDGNRHYEATRQITNALKEKIEIVINSSRTALNFNTHFGGSLTTVHNFVTDPNLRKKIIAQNQGNVHALDPTQLPGWPGNNNSVLDQPSTAERRYPEYDKYNDRNGKWSDKKYKQITRANCNSCHGTGISPYPSSSAGSRSAYHNMRGSKCPYCGQHTYHFHDRCASCS